MARQAVPTVLTGDSWSAAQHNTYIKDNEAAHWPYTTQGDMAYATSATVIARLAKGSAFQHLRMNSGATAPEWSSAFGIVLFSGAAENASWNGDSKAVGTYGLNASAFSGVDGAVPSTAKAILVAISARWTVDGDANTVNVKPAGAGSENCLVVRAQRDNIFQDGMGIVPLNSSGQFSVVVSSNNAEIYLDIWGYLQ